MPYVLEMEEIRKEFPGVLALDNVQLKVRPATVHAFMGENGAGKSTLMKILMGIYKPDSGRISFKGKTVNISNPITALKLGISMIHQELNPVLHMSIAENIWLGREPINALRFVDHAKMFSGTEKLLKNLDIDLNPNQKMVDLSVANQQMVEIAKAISYNAELIVMDEPTSAITEKEVEHLFRLIRDLKKRGVSIIYITHKMDEVFAIADDITVLRDGQYIGTRPASEMTKNSLISMMVGRQLSQIFPKRNGHRGKVVLSVKNLSRKGRFSDITFDLHAGEILGVAGLVGAGRTEVLETIFGVHPKTSGQVYINGEVQEILHPRDAMKHQMALLPKDRKLGGLFLMLDIRANMEISNLSNYLKGPFIRSAEVKKDCRNQVEQLNIRTPSLSEVIENLSGGNQQKVLLSRWLLTSPEILMLDEPTRGVDVGAKAEIHKLMSDLVAEGKSILMISSEMPEVLGMSDRIIVMHEGRLAGILNRKEATQEKILALASGEKLE